MNDNTLLNRATGLVLIVQGLLIFVPTFVLGAAINWPDSLRDPAAIALPRLLEQADAVRLGYLVYFIYSLLFLATTALVVRVLAAQGGDNGLLKIAQGAGALSALARAIGIIRWLVAMPVLAALFVDPSASAGSREAVAVVYQALNAYGGSIGELLGVTTFAALWTLTVSLVIVRQGGLPRWLGVLGIVTAIIMFISFAEVFGIDLGPVIIVTVLVEHLWLLAVGAVLLTRRAPQPRLTLKEA